MFRRRWFSSPKTERRYFFSTNQGSCDIYADGVYVGRYIGTGITEFTYSTSRNYINISLVGISLPDQVYNYTNGIITDSLAIYQGSTTDAKYTAIFDAEIYETIPVTNARVQSTMTDIVMNYKLGDFVSTSKKELINRGIKVYPGYDGFYRIIQGAYIIPIINTTYKIYVNFFTPTWEGPWGSRTLMGYGYIYGSTPASPPSQSSTYVTVTNNRQNAVRVLILTSLNVTDIQSLINRYGTTVVRSSKIYEYYDTANNIMTGFVEDKLPGQAYYAYMLDNELRTGVGNFTIV